MPPNTRSEEGRMGWNRGGAAVGSHCPPREEQQWPLTCPRSPQVGSWRGREALTWKRKGCRGGDGNWQNKAVVVTKGNPLKALQSNRAYLEYGEKEKVVQQGKTWGCQLSTVFLISHWTLLWGLKSWDNSLQENTGDVINGMTFAGPFPSDVWIFYDLETRRPDHPKEQAAKIKGGKIRRTYKCVKQRSPRCCQAIFLQFVTLLGEVTDGEMKFGPREPFIGGKSLSPIFKEPLMLQVEQGHPPERQPLASNNV